MKLMSLGKNEIRSTYYEENMKQKELYCAFVNYGTGLISTVKSAVFLDINY